MTRQEVHKVIAETHLMDIGPAGALAVLAECFAKWANRAVRESHLHSQQCSRTSKMLEAESEKYGD